MLSKSPMTNHYGHSIWKLTIPDEVAPGGVELGFSICADGLHLADGFIPWVEVDDARKEANEFKHGKPACSECGRYICKCVT